MYEKFYGFKEKPFHLVPNPRFLYHSKKHQNALTYLEYGLSEGSGFILLTGDIGAGKTTIIRHILNRIEDNIEVGVIFNTNVDSGELIDLVLHEFGLKSTYDNKAKSLDAIFQYLIRKYSQGKRVLLVVDEAQNLSVQALEEIRMLSNLQTDDQMLLQIMLIGQPELKRRLHSTALTQLSQRIAVYYHLGALEHDEIGEYITFRLEKAGGSLNIFENDTFDLIYQASGGIPRIINLLCDTALVYGYAESLERINTEVITQVIQDKGGLGLVGNGQARDEQAVPGKEHGAENHSPRLMALEEKVASLQQQIDWRLADIGLHGTQANERLVSELKELIRNERKKTDKLLLEYGRLKAGLGVQADNKNMDDEGGSGPAEVISSSLLSQETASDEGTPYDEICSKSESNWFNRILHILT